VGAGSGGSYRHAGISGVGTFATEYNAAPADCALRVLVMFVDVPALDYLTATTWSQPIYETTALLVAKYAVKPMRPGRRLQYRGIECDGLFVGEAIQASHMHYMLIASGMMAEHVAPDLLHLPLKATRVDMQVTSRKPADWDAISIADRLRSYAPVDWGKGGKKQVTVIQSGDGFDTLYIGARTSDRFMRVYVKPDSTGKAWLRCEVEYKRELARTAWKTLQQVDDHTKYIGLALQEEIEAVPGLYGILPADMLSACRQGASGTRPGFKRVDSGGSTLAWIRRQVEPAIMRAMRDHEAGPTVRRIIQDWAALATDIDNSDIFHDNEDDDLDMEGSPV
jgi:hypothetical protein